MGALIQFGSPEPKLTDCQDCGGKVSRRSAACPHCGAPLAQGKTNQALQPSNHINPIHAALVIVAALVLIPIYIVNQEKTAAKDPAAIYDPLKIPNAKPSLTLEQFNKLQVGMTYKQACEVIGREGVLSSQNKMEGLPDLSGDGSEIKFDQSLDTRLYEWDSEEFAAINAIFQNDRLVQKSQFGLK